MANSIYDPRIEPLWHVSVVDDESRARLGRMPCYENMTSTLGNRVISIRADGVRMRRATDGEEYIVRGVDIFLSVARQFGFNMTPAEIADCLINVIAGIISVNVLFRFEREWRDLGRRLNQHPTAVQPPEFKMIKYTEYDRVMKAYATRKRVIEQGR
jgi:hypothetical protein